MNGKNEFPVKITRKDIAAITANMKSFRIEDQEFVRTAPYDDVMTVYAVLSLVDFLKQRRCEPDFEVVLSE